MLLDYLEKRTPVYPQLVCFRTLEDASGRPSNEIDHLIATRSGGRSDADYKSRLTPRLAAQVSVDPDLQCFLFAAFVAVEREVGMMFCRRLCEIADAGAGGNPELAQELRLIVSAYNVAGRL